MKQTIGELVRYVLPYTNKIEISVINDIPFMRCILSRRTKMGTAYLYIIQMSEHQYAVCDNDDDLLGERYFPTGNISEPFVMEKDLIKSWFIGAQRDTSKYDRVKVGLNVDKFIDQFYEILSYYDVIRFDLKNYDVAIATSIGIGNGKLRKAISTAFNTKNKPDGTIRDLINIVIKNDDKLDLGQIKDNSIQFIKVRLSECYGIDITVKSNCIVDVLFEKRT